MPQTETETRMTSPLTSLHGMSDEELHRLAKDIELVTPEIYKPNDFYGHAHHLKERLGLPTNQPLKVALSHGPSLIDYVWEMDWRNELPLYLCHTQRFADLYMKVSGKPAIPVGPPVSFIRNALDPVPPPEGDKVLLYMPAHSTHHLSVENRFDEEAMMLEKVAGSFDRIVVSVYWKDVLRGNHLEYRKRGFECVTAGHMYDPGFLPRMLDIVRRSHAAVISYGGSAVPYTVLLNRPVWIPPIQLEMDAKEEVYVRHWEDVKSTEKSLRHQMFDLFSQPEFDLNDEQIEFIHSSTGMDFLRTDDELAIILQEAEERYKSKIKQKFQVGLEGPANGNTPESPRTIVAEISKKTQTSRSHTPSDDSGADLLREAMDALQQQEHGRALKTIDQVLGMGEPLQGTHLLKALALFHIGNIDEAEREVKEERRLFPENEDASLFLKQLSLARGNGHEMEETVSSNVDGNSSTRPLNMEHAGAEATVGSTASESTSDQLREAMRLIEKGDVYAALANLEQAEKKGAFLPGQKPLKALCYVRLGRMQDARWEVEEELRLFPNSAEAEEFLRQLDQLGSSVSQPSQHETKSSIEHPPLSAFYFGDDKITPFVYVATYPRSGTTWMLRSLIQLYNGQEAELDSKQYSKHKIPLLNGHYVGVLNPVDRTRPVVVKTHSEYAKFIEHGLQSRVIYVLRDGRDALTSYYFFKQTRVWKRSRDEVRFDAKEFARELKKDATSWRKHVEEWLNVQGVILVRYEEMKEDYESVIQRIHESIQLPKACTIADLKRTFVDEFQPNGDFFRKGIVGDWQNYWTDEHKAIFKKTAGDLLIRLRYAEDLDW